jgi:hypothetical protein
VDIAPAVNCPTGVPGTGVDLVSVSKTLVVVNDNNIRFTAP